MSKQNMAQQIQIAVGSQNPVKIAAVKDVVEQIWPAVNIVGLAANSQIAEQPLTDDEAILGATNRAKEALQLAKSDFGVGIEGTTVDTAYGMFTTAWTVVVDCDGKIGYGASGRLPLPDNIAQEIRAGQELGPLMDLLSKQKNTKQKQGAVGILTNGLIARTEALTLGVIYAFSPFIRPNF